MPCVGVAGLPGYGLTADCLNKIQRFWPSEFSEYLQLIRISTPSKEYNSIDITKTTQTCSDEASSSSQLTCNHSSGITNDVLQDTIGFFIAKFVKL